MMRIPLFIILGISFLFVFTCINTANAWTPKVVADDPVVRMPGSQPGEGGNTEHADKCDNCHTAPIEEAWRGSMMAQAARDPLWYACLTVAGQDSIWAVGNPNAQDICIRCHAPAGWLEGRSDPTNTSALQGTDFDGVQCDFCHRMVDPFTELGQPDVDPEEPGSEAESLAQETYLQDRSVLEALTLFDGSPFLAGNNLPVHYGDGSFPNYIKAVTGQYFIDPGNAKRGPFSDAQARHQWYYSRFHKSKDFCSTCHDVSNPILASVLPLGGNDLSLPEKQVGSSYFHVERTTSEFLLGAYAADGGSDTRGGVAASGVTHAEKCQDCHMRNLLNTKGCNKKGTPARDDLPFHDLTGSNQWIMRILASVDANGPYYDLYNDQILSGNKYAGATIDVAGIQGTGVELWDGAERAVQQIGLAASLTYSEDSASVTFRVQNNTGHKLISGFPEGRRMFLNVKFYDVNGDPIPATEINEYAPLVTTQDGQGNEVYVSGGDIVAATRNENLVWEAQTMSDLTGENHTFHFALATDRWKDNRIPPKGFPAPGDARWPEVEARFVQPRSVGADAPGYFTTAEYHGGYDEVTVTKPAGTVTYLATLYYQTTSKGYVEFLRDEINGTGDTLNTLGNPALPPLSQLLCIDGGTVDTCDNLPNGTVLNPDADPAYLVQTDPFFDNLKGWGNALWDLWLHNNGAAPVVMDQIGDIPAPPCDPPTAPATVTAEPGKKKSITVTWSTVAEADSYNVYYSLAGKYTQIANTTSESYKDGRLTSGQQYCYVVTSLTVCPDQTVEESDYSVEACATAR
jgi:hypothetical protein